MQKKITKIEIRNLEEKGQEVSEKRLQYSLYKRDTMLHRPLHPLPKFSLVPTGKLCNLLALELLKCNDKSGVYYCARLYVNFHFDFKR